MIVCERLSLFGATTTTGGDRAELRAYMASQLRAVRRRGLRPRRWRDWGGRGWAAFHTGFDRYTIWIEEFEQ